ncbi:tape measure protein [Arthrobacter phage Racecar]|nr:tape measure protein [Arthrobacter phage Racecar]QFG12846.1 tape measure protein [Arthrobacter phage Mimi]
MAIIGSAYVEIRALDSKLQRDVDKAVSKIKDVNLTLQANVNLKPVRDKISLLRAELKRSPLKFRAEVDLDRVMDDIGAAYELYDENPLELQANVNTHNVATVLEDIKSRYGNITSTVQANASTAAAEAQMAAVSRNRRSTVNMGLKLDPSYQKALKGLGYTIMGAVPGDKVKAAILGTAGNFESLAIAGAKTATVFGSISSVIGTLGADVLTIGADISHALKIVNLAPAVFGMLGAGIIATTLAWKGFGDAFDKDAKKAAEALAKLPPNAQKAVLALRGVGGAIKTATQKAYWEQMGDSIERLHDKFIPALKKGLEGSGTAMGKMTKEFVDGLREAAAKGHVDKMFAGINKGLTNMAKGVQPVIESLFQIGAVGSKYLGKLGDKLGQAGIDFGKFIDEADKAGKIDVWIKQSIATFKELGSILSSSGQIMKGLTLISDASGGKGLDDLAAGLRGVADTVNNEPFKSNLITILSGARKGAEALGRGFGKIASTVGNASQSVGIFLELAGQVGGELLERINDVFDGTGIGAGFTTALNGAKTALSSMEPAFRNLGKVLGDLGTIAGTLFVNMAPGVNQLMDTVAKVVAELKDGLIAVIPIFNQFVQSILAVAAPLAVAFADAIGNIFVAFSKLPGALQTVLMSLGLFLLFKNKFANFFSGLGTSLDKENNRTRSTFGKIADGARETSKNVRNSFQGLGFGIAETGRLAAQGFGKNIDLVTNGLPGKAAQAGRDFKAGLANGLNMTSEFNGVGQRFDALKGRISTSAQNASSNVRGAFSKLGNMLAPAGGAVDNFVRTTKAMGDQMHYNLAPARDAFGALEKQAKTAGRNAASSLGSGLKSGLSGAMGLLGGPWGVALAGATMAVGVFAEAQANAEAKVTNLAQSLDQQTGAFTGAAKNMLANDWLDIDASAWDDLWRSGRRNMEELVRDTGINSAKVTEILSNPQGRDAWVDNWKKIRDAAGEGKDVNEQLAASVGMTKEQLAGLSQTDLNEMTRQFEDAANTAKKAEERVRAVAEATGTSTAAAAQLAANYDILSSSTASVDQKVSALKQNLDLLNGGMQAARRSGRDYAETQLNITDGIKGIAEANGATILANGQMEASFRKTLLAADGTFSTTTRGAIDFSKQMDTAASSILTVGMAEMEKLTKAGAKPAEAQAAALKSMEAPMEALRDRLGRLGFDAGQVNGIMAQLGLDPEKLRGALVLETGDAEKNLARFELMKAAFTQGNWSVALTATSDEVKAEMMKIEEIRKAYETGGWEAVVDVINKGGPKIQDFLLGLTEAKDKEDVKKVLDAEFKGKTPIAEAGKALDGWNRTPAQIKELKGTDKASEAAKTATDGVKTFNGEKLLPKYFKGIDETTPPLMIAKDGVERWNALTPAEKHLLGYDEASTAAGAAVDALGVFDLTNPVPKSLRATNETQPAVTSSQTTMDTLKGVTRGLYGANQAAAGKAAAQGTLNSLVNVTRALFADNKAGIGKSAAQLVINALTGKTVDLNANDKASGVVDDVNRKGIADKSFNIIGVLTGVSAAVRNMLGMAVGGIMGGDGIQKFANGGFSGSNVSSFAGGSEKHVAQIARGKWPVRIWAEPETGGEAYIPLSKSKRPRSEKILEQVAKMFGMTLVRTKAYANGGVEGGRSSSSSSSSLSSSNISPVLLNSIAKGMMKDNTNLNKIGEYVVDGIIGGVNNKSGKAVESMTTMAGSLEDAVRTRLDIHSPSKTFLALGKYIVDGLTLGLKTNAGGVHKQISTLANRIYVAASDIHKATGKSIGSSLNLLNRQKTLNGAWKKMAAWKYTDQIVDYYQKTGKTGNRTLADIARAREDVNVRLASAQKRLKDLQSARADVYKEVSGRMKGEFKLGTSIVGETNPYIPQMKFSDVKNYTTGLASRLKTFNSKIQALKKKGVSAGLIQEVASLGSVEGISVADAILQGSSADIKGLNSSYASIGTIASQVGNTAADGMYKVGIDAQAGLVRGLQKDSASLTSAANKLTGQLIAQVKKNLGIRSPSRVFAEIGVFTGQGLIKGMDQIQGEVDKRVNTMINLDPRQVDVTGTVTSSNTATSTPQQVVNMTINPSTGMDEQAVGRAAVKELNWQLLSR